ncbi:MAG TPA: hypothetical protein VI358_03095, partial [Pseudolabrys sp.]
FRELWARTLFGGARLGLLLEQWCSLFTASLPLRLNSPFSAQVRPAVFAVVPSAVISLMYVKRAETQIDIIFAGERIRWSAWIIFSDNLKKYWLIGRCGESLRRSQKPYGA